MPRAFVHELTDFGAQSPAVLQCFADRQAAPVEKANVLAMLDEVTTLEDVRNLASDEDVEKWQSA
ncbi:hypothetical protein [Nostoc sp.]|uniref:hypothetical protein n=1 Tax=Nostoc sp. TaxID=1180 RepID=UPI002FFA0D47